MRQAPRPKTPPGTLPRTLTVPGFRHMKQAGEKIAMVTCYDFTSALIANATPADALLVGDSLAMTMHGFETTVPATMEMMVHATAAVARGARDKFIVGDLPFASYRKSLPESVEAAAALMRAGAHAVKLEGLAGNAGLVAHLVQSGIPVMGHIGLTPQFVHQLGGYKVQGRTGEDAERLLAEARALEDAGCFALVLECVPPALAEKIARALSIPVIGIGAGSGTDGQVLVWQDLLGLNDAFRPRFVKRYAEGAQIFRQALSAYAAEVKSGAFPAEEHGFENKKPPLPPRARRAGEGD